MRFISFAAALLLLTLVSCDLTPTPLDIDIPAPEQELVISSFAVPPQELLVTVSRTFSALLGEDSVDVNNPDIASSILVDSALVTVSYNGITDTLTKIAPGIYGTVNVQQIENANYQLYAYDYKTGKSVRAETRFLKPVPLDTVYPTQRYLSLSNDTLFSFKYAFTDRPGEENYYLATYTSLNDLQNLATPGTNLFSFSSQTFNVFTDQNNGDGKAVEFEPEFGNWGQNDTLVVGLSNISREYYNFLSAYKRSGNLFSQLTGEPVNLPTNVEGGYGYFAMIKPSVRVVILR